MHPLEMNLHQDGFIWGEGWNVRYRQAWELYFPPPTFLCTVLVRIFFNGLLKKCLIDL